MLKSIRTAVILFMSIVLLSGCMNESQSVYSEYQKYSNTFFDSFDTIIQVVAYTKSEEEFNQYYEQIHNRFLELHRQYDIFNQYEGINNLKTINDSAGFEPVSVSQDIIDLIQYCKQWYAEAGEETNIAMGEVLSIWQEYRDEAIVNPEEAKLPPIEELRAAAQHMDMSNVIVDTDKRTVYLADPNMSLNVGAVAKGYATEIVAREIKAAGLQSAIISAGGNVRTIGTPYDGIRDHWGIGIQHPDRLTVTAEENLLDTVFIDEASVVSSGDYQRYYEVDGKRIHHLIDPKTLMPGDYYRAVTVVTKDAGLADFLSTVLFLLPYEQSKAYVDQMDGVEALWVLKDGTVTASKGMEQILKSKGATSVDKQ